MHAIIISGPPASGKTRLSRILARELSVPLLARDTIKEALFDSLGHSDRTWSMKLGAASYDVLFALAEASFQAGAPCVILEANFTERAGQQLQALADRHGVSLIQVFCHASPEVLWQRFQQRVASGERHPGHVDSENLDEARERIAQTADRPLDLKGALIDVDTSDSGDEKRQVIQSSINAIIRKNQFHEYPPNKVTTVGQTGVEVGLLAVCPAIATNDLNRLFAAVWPDHAPVDGVPLLSRALVYVGAYDEGRLIGFAKVISDGGGHGFLLDPIVEPARQRLGIGTRLVRLCIEEARLRGLQWLHVDYVPSLRSFYMRCGFKPSEAGVLRLGGDPAGIDNLKSNQTTDSRRNLVR